MKLLRITTVATSLGLLKGQLRFLSDNGLEVVAVADNSASRREGATTDELKEVERTEGVRTVDIYMIHYFLIPDLSWMSEWLANGNMVIPQIIISVVLTAAIVAVCLLLSSIIRKSSILDAWLFGVKRKSIA